MQRWCAGIGAVLACLALAGVATAANIKNFIEAARCTPVVYAGVVRGVTIVSSNNITATARAEVDVKAVGRGGEPPASGAGFMYYTYADNVPPMDGPPQHALRPGMWVLVFVHGYDGEDGVSYLREGTREEVATLVHTFAESTPNLVDDKLAFNEISAAERDTQAAMYRLLAERLDAVH